MFLFYNSITKFVSVFLNMKTKISPGTLSAIFHTRAWLPHRCIGEIVLAAKHVLEWKFKSRRRTNSTRNLASNSLLALFHDFSLQVMENLLLRGLLHKNPRLNRPAKLSVSKAKLLVYITKQFCKLHHLRSEFGAL